MGPAVSKTTLGANLVAGGFLLILLAQVIPFGPKMDSLIAWVSAILPVLGLWVMQKDAANFGAVHRGRLAVATVLAVGGLLVTRSAIRVLAKDDGLSAVFMSLRVQAAADALLVIVVAFAFWTLAKSGERALFAGGAALVLAASGITAMVPTLLMDGTDVTAMMDVAIVLLSLGCAALALAARIFGSRVRRGPERPKGMPFGLDQPPQSF